MDPFFPLPSRYAFGITQLWIYPSPPSYLNILRGGMYHPHQKRINSLHPTHPSSPLPYLLYLTFSSPPPAGLRTVLLFLLFSWFLISSGLFPCYLIIQHLCKLSITHMHLERYNNPQTITVTMQRSIKERKKYNGISCLFHTLIHKKVLYSWKTTASNKILLLFIILHPSTKP